MEDRIGGTHKEIIENRVEGSKKSEEEPRKRDPRRQDWRNRDQKLEYGGVEEP
jgi:hypothetical protein